VATQTLREARNRDEFLSMGSQILGFPIEVISGMEEGRLIFQGVTHLLPHTAERRLVIDIGGRSTEVISGIGYAPKKVASYRVGSVSSSIKNFKQGEITAQSLHKAEVAAQAIIDDALSQFPKTDWDLVYGSSGTVGAVADILSASGWSSAQITREGLDWLIKCLLRAGHVDRIQIDGLKEDRRAVICGGISVLRAVMDVLDIDNIHVAQGALRHGLLFDMLDRRHESKDQREVSVKRLLHRFAVDQEHAQRVDQVAQFLFAQIMNEELQSGYKDAIRKLSWASQLHEVGSVISHVDHHKHGAYIIDHAEVFGFSDDEMHRLGMLILGQKGKLRKLDADWSDERFCRMLLSLRLAVIFCHARTTPQVHDLILSQHPHRMSFKLILPKEWNEQFPQSTHLLQLEQQAWEKTSCSFELVIQ
jgi:exopolyphosphatase/guanosine-5'-triphosphate,3'-diphosphate pyrophosphatase